jgi:hypothetical protein
MALWAASYGLWAAGYGLWAASYGLYGQRVMGYGRRVMGGELWALKARIRNLKSVRSPDLLLLSAGWLF